MEIVHDENNKEFIQKDGDKIAGKITYTWAGDHRFIIDHTEVNSEYGGQGVGKKLVLAAVAYARENTLKIIPLCPFAKSTFEKIEEIKDVLA